MELKNFNGKIVRQVVNSNKICLGRNIRALIIADLHGYTNNPILASRLAEAIKREDPDIIFIAGDIYSGGKPWDGGEKLEQFRKFIENISEVAPVCITWGNHDLRSIKNKDARIWNLRKLEDVRPGSVYPLYNDVVIINDMEIVGFVPRFELMEGPGLKTQVHGLAHDEFIRDFNEHGARFSNEPGVLNIYLGHDPHLIAASENGIGLGNLSDCDFFIAGHLHDGYKTVVEYLDRKKKSLTGRGFKSINPEESLSFDRGWTDQPFSIVDKNGKTIKRERYPFYLGQINLCRGIVYINNDAQQKYLQMPDGKFYRNASSKDNVQVWEPVLEDIARKDILESNLHFMIISEGITPVFKPKEELATINVVDITGAKVKTKSLR